MTQAQFQMEKRQNHNPEQEAMLAAGCESCELLRDSAEGRVRPESAAPSGEAAAQGRCGREKCAVIPRHTPTCPRAIAARQLARQAELEAERYLKLAASLRDDLRLTRARQRVGWTYTPEADEEGPG